MAEIKNSESDMSTQQKAELDKEKRKEEKKEAKRAKRQHYRENSPCLRKWEMQSPME